MGVDPALARHSLMAAAGRTAELVASLDMDRPVAGLDWSVGETAAHLVIALRVFTSSVLGDDREWREWEDRIPDVATPDRMEIVNRLMIAAEPRRVAAAAARAIADGAGAFLAATAGLSPAQVLPTPWYGRNDTLTVAAATCLLLGEQVIHGHDMARSARRRWPIRREDALLIFDAVRTMMPKLANPAMLDGVSASYDIRLGRSSRFVVTFGHGTASVEPGPGHGVDCHLLAEPVALLLLGYGRTTQWRAIAGGKLLTWGRRPWLAFRLPGFFSHP